MYRVRAPADVVVCLGLTPQNTFFGAVMVKGLRWRNLICIKKRVQDFVRHFPSNGYPQH